MSDLALKPGDPFQGVELVTKARQEFYALSSKFLDITKFFCELSARDRQFYGLKRSPLLEKRTVETTTDCFAIIGTLYKHYQSPGKKSHECPDYRDIEQLFDEIFLAEAREANQTGQYFKASEALSKVGCTLADSTIVKELVERSLERNDVRSAIKCLSKISFTDKWKMELQVGLCILKQPEIADDLMEQLLTFIKKIYPNDTDSSLVKGIIERCLKEKRYYKIAIEAAGWLCCLEPFAYVHEQVEILTRIAESCLENQDLEAAYEAYGKMYFRHPPPSLPLQEKIAEGLIKKGEYEKARVIAERMPKDSIKAQGLLLKVYCKLENLEKVLEIIKKMPRELVKDQFRDVARTLFYVFKTEKRYKNALDVAAFINDEEKIRHLLRYLSWDIRGTPELSKRALNLAFRINETTT